MHLQLHLVMAISLSMVITFGLHCAIKDLPLRDSVFQHVVVDFSRGIALVSRCIHYDRRSKTSFWMDDEGFFVFRWSDLFVIDSSWRYYSSAPCSVGFDFHRRISIVLWCTDPPPTSSSDNDPLRCWLPRSMPRFSRDLRSDRRCYYLFRRVAVHLRVVELDVA